MIPTNMGGQKYRGVRGTFFGHVRKESLGVDEHVPI